MVNCATLNKGMHVALYMKESLSLSAGWKVCGEGDRSHHVICQHMPFSHSAQHPASSQDLPLSVWKQEWARAACGSALGQGIMEGTSPPPLGLFYSLSSSSLDHREHAGLLRRRNPEGPGIPDPELTSLLCTRLGLMVHSLNQAPGAALWFLPSQSFCFTPLIRFPFPLQPHNILGCSASSLPSSNQAQLC